MCGRYGVVRKVEVYEKRFNVKFTQGEFEFKPTFNVSVGKYAPVIASNSPSEIQLFQFGLTPFWAKKPMYLFNARSEGDGNQDNDENYHGGKGIISKPSFRKPIRSQRCLVIADYYVEGPEKERLDKPYLIYMRNREPFALAGIWDTWKNPENGEVRNSFSIITTVRNELTKKIGHHRSPVIIRPSKEKTWLKSEDLAEVTAMLEPYDAEEMNAYPISPRIKSPKNNDAELMTPVGEPLFKETGIKISSELKLFGFGEPPAKVRRKEQDDRLKNL